MCMLDRFVRMPLPRTPQWPFPPSNRPHTPRGRKFMSSEVRPAHTPRASLHIWHDLSPPWRVLTSPARLRKL
ncbi:uncharacterized protein SCHCODRAFT_02587527 [Schizophyllum commune H4-8]|uniref:uncharacterized protein n=1 Tax=Schizophyllum commune (strain H4-8 / FGSC 9210) TaxID=578458 RepID=UPI00215F34BE|nr:uncharacterized protein SCHCODRAFT_02587527 [Schizophyllum commune H4-8]KAI5888452.1 hypothetical protein SCHCODRAFT_02587527 [Schizophyllum commune H4-8]